MKKNFRKVGFILSMVAITSFTMTSCAEGGEEETTTEAEGGDAHADHDHGTEGDTPAEENCGGGDSEETCGDGHTEENCGGGDANDSTAVSTCGTDEAGETTCGGGDAEEAAH